MSKLFLTTVFVLFLKSQPTRGISPKIGTLVIDSATENGQYIVSVRFTGTVSEDLNSLPQPFTEIWHFVKLTGSNQDWLVAGIQQEQ